VAETADRDQHDSDIGIAGIATMPSEIIRNAPVTELATTEFTREQPNQRVYSLVR
jgi:hypothetical protein